MLLLAAFLGNMVKVLVLVLEIEENGGGRVAPPLVPARRLHARVKHGRCSSFTHRHYISLKSGLWIRNNLFRIRLRIRLLRKFRLRLRIRILDRILQRWSPPRKGCAANSHFIREITTFSIETNAFCNISFLGKFF